MHRRIAAALVGSTVLMGASLPPTLSGAAAPDVPLHPTAALVELELLPADGILNGATGVNDLGAIVGHADGRVNHEAAWWDVDGQGERLGIPVATVADECCSEEESYLTGINIHEQVVGNSITQEVVPAWGYAWRRDPDGTVVQLSAPHAFVEDINDLGVAAGFEWSPEGWRAVTWGADGARDFVGPPGTIASAINNAGELAGSLLDDPTFGGARNQSPVRFDADGTMHLLPGRGVATDISETGAVAGYVSDALRWRLARWAPDGTPTISDIHGMAFGIDANGLVVGRTGDLYPEPGQWTPIVWDPDTGTTHALPTGTATGGAATAINDEGQVVGLVAVASTSERRWATRAVTWYLEGAPEPPAQAGPSTTNPTGTTNLLITLDGGAAPPATPVAGTPRFTG